MKEAMFYEKMARDKVQCNLCAHRCVISKSRKGICGVRQNLDGTLYVLNYGKLVAQHVDPIEKKPFYHFCPGTKAYSIAAAGCNFKCP
jgi:pyruvate formate lyase activating enzyme